MSRSIFTPEELAELAAFDAAVKDEPLTLEEWRETMLRDREISGPRKPYSAERRARQREQSKAYRDSHREYAREAHRAWYAKNREYALAWQRDYYRRHAAEKRQTESRFREQHRRDQEAATVRAIRKRLCLTQRQLGAALGRSAAVVHTWETGKTRVPEEALRRISAMAAEASAGTRAAAQDAGIVTQSNIITGGTVPSSLKEVRGGC